MNDAKINAAIDRILKEEGGFVNDPDDLGKATNFGITQKTLSQWRGCEVSVEDVQNLSIDEAREIYKERYITKPNYHKIESVKLFNLVVDTAVNMGVSRASKWLQEAAKVNVDGIVGNKTIATVNKNSGAIFRIFFAERMKFYGEIITSNPSQAKFAKGWLKRLARFLTY